MSAPPKLYKRSPCGESSGQGATRLKLEGGGRFAGKKARQAEYRAEKGISDNDAHEMALNDFPPLEEADSVGAVDSDPRSGNFEMLAGAAPSDVSGPVEIDMSTPDIRRDAYWAYNHIGRKDITREQAPSQGAWNMFKHFGANAGTVRDFLEEIAKPMLKGEPKGESYSDDGRELIALCERKRAEFVAEREREEAEEAA